MIRLATPPSLFGILVSGMVAAALAAGCGSNKVAIGLQNVDAQAPGLDAAKGSDAPAAGSGGVTGSGGATATGGSTRTGGTPGGGLGGTGGSGGSPPSTGGTIATGGIPTGAGGATGTGGLADAGVCPTGQVLCPGCSVGVFCGFPGGCPVCPPLHSDAGCTGSACSNDGGTGGAGKTCGGVAGANCAAGEFCDLLAGSCNVSDATGTCVANVGVGCTTIYQPACGCNGHTYPSDCDRQVAGVSKKSDGACPTGDAGATTCGQVTTQAECDSRSDCHSVFMDMSICDCSAIGCCENFIRCADGGRANCSPPAGFGCAIAQPACGGAYVTSYTSNCYEGCVLASECAVAADAGVIMTPTLPAACQVDGDCCVAMDTCTAMAYLVGRTEYPTMVASIPSISSGVETCLRCIPPAVQVRCNGGFCAGEKLPISSSALTTSHCGYISVSDAGSSTGFGPRRGRRWHGCGPIDLELWTLVPGILQTGNRREIELQRNSQGGL